MRKLIDKIILRKELSKLPSEMGFVRKLDVMQILGSQKCAYDVGKVVEQLECNDCERCLFCETCAGSKYCEDCHDKIIDIVKKVDLKQSNPVFHWEVKICLVMLKRKNMMSYTAITRQH